MDEPYQIEFNQSSLRAWLIRGEQKMELTGIRNVIFSVERPSPRLQFDWDMGRIDTTRYTEVDAKPQAKKQKARAV